MPNGYGRGFGYGGGRGFGFRGASPPWPYVGRGRGGLPRCWHPGVDMAPPYPPAYPVEYPAPWPTPSYTTREQELDFLKEESKAVRGHLEEIESRIRELETTEE